MTKTHQSLSPLTNILLAIVWGSMATLLFFKVEPRIPPSIGLVGALLGAVCGVLQHFSIKQATSTFKTASSLLEIRRAFKSTPWGRRYIWWLYFSKVVIAASAFLLIRHPLVIVLLGYLAGYLFLMFVRELVTLQDTFFLKHRSSN